MIASQWINGIGYMAAFCTTIAFVPQIIRVLKLRSAREISLGMALIFSFGVIMWLIYGLMLRSRPVIIANAATLLLSVGLVILKLYYGGRERRDLSQHPRRAKV
ncbi:MAG TPA: SemiSWEET transporter [Acidobacteriaceae bacterium]|nr:SemiSWEET transporter [Acidobacteriaceae bacterium]